MEFSIQKSDLVRELGLSQGVVERKTTIPILSNVLLEAADGRLKVTATDLELWFVASCPAKVKTVGSGTIPARRLLDYVRLLPDGELSLKFTENQWAQIVCGRSRTKIAGMSRESFPELPMVPETLAEIPVSTMTSMIQSTIFAISAEESRFTLNGALLILDGQGVTMVATDGHRLSMVRQSLPFDLASPFRALIPRKAMSELLKLAGDAKPDENVLLSGDENHLFFQIGGRTLVSRKLTGNFPDFERVLPAEHPHQVTLRRDDLRSALERVAQFSDERSRAVRVKVDSGEIRVYSSLSDTGESEENIEVAYSEEPVEIGFNAQYLLDFLKSSTDPEARFLFRDANSAGELRPASGDGQHRYVVMPMRI